MLYNMKSSDWFLSIMCYSVTFYIAVDASSLLPSNRTVSTKYGYIRGLYKMPQNSTLQPVEIFLGVPYARPPVNDLRFEPPKTPLAWDGVKECNEFPPVCPQKFPDIDNIKESLQRMPRSRYLFLKRIRKYLKNESEDCLYLNIYSPYSGK